MGGSKKSNTAGFSFGNNNSGGGLGLGGNSVTTGGLNLGGGTAGNVFGSNNNAN